MRQPLDLSLSREQLCPLCHDRGYYEERRGDGIVPCAREECRAGRAYRAVIRAQTRLSAVYDQRNVELWLQSRIPALGGERAINLLREGREDEVLAVIERIPGMPPPDPEAEDVPPPVSVTPVEEPKADAAALRRVLSAKLRQRGERRIADALESASVSDLPDRDRAVLDSALTGTGFLVDGVRVDPARVQFFRWPS